MGPRAPGLDFDKYQAVTVEGDQIDFAQTLAVAAGDDAIPQLLQEASCGLLAVWTEPTWCGGAPQAFEGL